MALFSARERLGDFSHQDASAFIDDILWFAVLVAGDRAACAFLPGGTGSGEKRKKESCEGDEWASQSGEKAARMRRDGVGDAFTTGLPENAGDFGAGAGGEIVDVVLALVAVAGFVVALKFVPLFRTGVCDFWVATHGE